MNRTATRCLSVLLAFAVLFCARLVPRWGCWYSDNLPYRWQDQAFLQGHLSLAPTPVAIQWDLAWGNGVQQIWGLAVPFWRLPFEALAKALGFMAFPDRISFGVLLSLVTYAIFRFSKKTLSKGSGQFSLTLIALFSTVLFPPFLVLCCSQFNVYEEVIAYGYLVSMLLCIWTIELWQRPNAKSYLIIAAVSGLVLMVRPTLLAYGVTSFIVASVAIRKLKARVKLVAFGCILFSLGIVAQLSFNAVRFGAPSEFGHSLMFNNVENMCFASRFDNPYRVEPCLSASKELFSLLFLAEPAGDGHGYGRGLYPWQSNTLRWRELYFKPYDLDVFLIMLCSVAVFVYRVYRRKSFGGDEFINFDLLVVWALVSMVPLLLFYLHFPFISSRYLIDFAPSFACLIWAFFLAAFYACKANAFSDRKTKVTKLILVMLMGFCWIDRTLPIRVEARRTLSISELKGELQLCKEIFSSEIHIPSSCYTNGFDFGLTGVPFNGNGWTPSETPFYLPLFVQNPKFLVLDMSCKNLRSSITNDCKAIEVKVGLERLRRESIAISTNQVTVRFFGPEEEQYKHGVQALFIGFINSKNLGYLERSPLRLEKVTWREQSDH